MDIESTIGLLIGLAMIPYGANGLIKHASALAKQLNLSEVLIGIVILGFGSSLPELMVSLDAALLKHADVAIGNIVGSNIANMALVIAVTAVIRPIIINSASIKMEGLAMLCATLLFTLFTRCYGLSFLPGIIFILVLIAYLYYQYKKSTASKLTREEGTKKQPVLTKLIKLFLFLTLLLAGVHLFLNGILILGAQLGIAKSTTGLIFAAIGTSLPELIICIVAAQKQHPELILGNIIGSNIFNLLGIGGMIAIVAPIEINPTFFQVDYYVLIILTLLFTLMSLRKKSVISRKIGVTLLLFYSAYTAYLFI